MILRTLKIFNSGILTGFIWYSKYYNISIEKEVYNGKDN